MVDQTTQQETDVFSQSKQEANDLVAELVGEGKKFKTVEALAQGKLQADVHIARLEQENKAFREQLAGAKSVEDILEAIKTNAAVGTNQSDTQENTESASATPSISAEQIAKIVAEQVSGLETAKTKAKNKKTANDLLVGMFGDKASEIFEKEAHTPELRAALISLAETDPNKFAAVFKRDGTGTAVDSGEKAKSAAAASLLNGSGPEQGTQAYYSKLRKENPKAYYSPAIQLEMHKAALQNPAKYFGRN